MTKNLQSDLAHTFSSLIAKIDIGILTLDSEFNIQYWNRFLENHSGILSDKVIGRNLFDTFPYIDSKWLKFKIKQTIFIEAKTFTKWSERPYLFKFKNTKLITHQCEFMYQNIEISQTGTSTPRIVIYVYDVTNSATTYLELQQANSKLHQTAQTDGQTGVLKLEHWKIFLGYDLETKKLNNTSIVIFDIDSLTVINNTHGHIYSAQAIVSTANIINSRFPNANVGRWGSDEFIISTQESIGTILHKAEKVRDDIEKKHIKNSSESFNFTVSAGVCEHHGNPKAIKETIKLADSALLAAKKTKNCILYHDIKTNKIRKHNSSVQHPIDIKQLVKTEH